MAWGFNTANPNPPFCHVTNRGDQALENLTRDPSNPNGYLEHLRVRAEISDISYSYLSEALECYVAGLYKAAAVLVGGAAESTILELRDAIVDKLSSVQQELPNNINDWRVRKIVNVLKSFFDGKKQFFDTEVREEYEAYWTAFTQQIRAVRNEVGHPSSINPITPDTVHASFLIFPELSALATNLKSWIENEFQ